MSPEERHWVPEADKAVRNIQEKYGTAVGYVLQCLQNALEVSKPLAVCEKCLKIGGCEHTKT